MQHYNSICITENQKRHIMSPLHFLFHMSLTRGLYRVSQFPRLLVFWTTLKYLLQSVPRPQQLQYN